MNGNAGSIDVSVLVLSYYHEKYIAQALESVLTQETDLTYEILVGDDASGDRTPEIVREYAQRYPDIIKPVLRKKNTGAGYNGWDLIRRSKGTYTATLEGDDFWLDPKKMQKQWEFLEAHKEYVGCTGKCVIVDENGTPDYQRGCHFAWNKKVFTLQDLIDSWQVPGQVGAGMTRNFLRDMDPEEYSIFYTAHPNVGDKTGTLLALAHGPIYCFNEVFSCYRVVDKKGEHNWFSIHHSNPYRNYDMFMYPCKLESWARKNMDLPRNQHLGKRNAYRFARFVEECVHSPTPKRLKYLAEMVAGSHQPLKYCWYILKALIEMED
ncbi:glycosyltransferase [Acutalibacter sp. 1XD8-33]|uniref:glycosyltransferase family 2 protein n=1 Tax=Acutalibacter sp. 1XD8-33 TaxID=2320081 RepID=UPI000EA0E514|nr:glycosyltransferase [Acutalibacter sp. 1XD8-33]RKJ41984.1 glycosyltransferase [Acutalibacter sp. 1XD8-33]